MNKNLETNTPQQIQTGTRTVPVPTAPFKLAGLEADRFAISSWSSVRPGKLGVDGRGGSCDLVSREGGCCLFGLMKVGLQPVAILDLLPQQLHLLSSNTPG